ncbi:MAG: NADH-quinone oxidoreductase subunit NuoH [Planctomycetes bacterium]|nr:NADH-quinone oxidoreductase subunit NuoH [Planctomycetota bacterium]
MTQFSVPWKQATPVEYRGPARGIVALARIVYSLAAPIVSRFPGPILIGAIVVTTILVWAHWVVFGIVETIALSDVNGATRSLWDQTLTVTEIGAYLDGKSVFGTGLIKYLLWPLQIELVRDLVGLGAIFGLFNLIPVYAIWWERKVAGRIQSRMGPMRVGGWHGWAQSFADGVKLVGKEDLVPAQADAGLFRIAPYLAFVPSLLAFLCLPLGSYWVFRNVDVALIFIAAMIGVEVVGVIIAGWASNNKWSIYGAMREACQMVSYEIPMTTVLLIPIMTAGTLNMVQIGDLQSGGWHTWVAFHNPFTFIAFITYYIASLANCKRAPFDLPESESELVAGFHTEYSGFRWALFFFAEYAAMFVVSGLAVTLFLGAWHTPLPSSWAFTEDSLIKIMLNGILFSSPFWFIFKCMIFIYIQIWIRWTLPRVRIDQVLYSCVQVMFPVACVALVGHAVWMVTLDGTTISKIIQAVLALIGAGVVVSFLSVAVYGYVNGRRMVGYLAVKQLPGS